MASRQRARGPKKERSPNQLAELGIFNIPDFDVENPADDSDVDEGALESELEALLTGKAPGKAVRPKKKVAPPVDIERIAAECMKDIDGDDEDDDVDLSDPDLLRELQGLSCDSPEDEVVVDEAKEAPPPIPAHKPSTNILSLLDERLKLYQEATAAAKAINDSSKVRRYGRAVKTLEGLIKSAKANKVINEEDIPPVVSIPARKKPPPAEPLEPAHDVPSVNNTSNSIPVDSLIDFSPDHVNSESSRKPQVVEERTDECKALTLRRDQYKIVALQAKRAGDKATALNYMKTAKGFDALIEAINRGETVDLSSVPPPPPPYQAPAQIVSSTTPKEHEKAQDATQTSSAMEAAAMSAASEPEDPAMFAAPPAPTSIMEALEQRLEKYKSTKAAAAAENNSGKVRRLDRIIKSYEKAIKDHKAGKNVDFEELPTPPGFAPIPVNVPPPAPPKKEPAPPVPETVQADKSSVAPAPPKRPAPQVPPSQSAQQQPKPKLQRTNTSTVEKQLEFLLERQKLFRQAALTSKQNGDIQQAKEYLRMSKGFDSMIEATKCGLPIDASSIPTPPQLESDDFVVVDVSECVEDDGSCVELLDTLEKDLIKQIEVCTRNKEHFLRLGDVTSASKFEKLGIESKKDLSVIRHLQKTGQSAPKFHYETRLFSVVQCHTDLSDNDLEVRIERGINLPGKPDDLDSYVKIDFPIPSEAPQKAKTHTVRDTNNPVFEEDFKFEINRKSRSQQRQFKRHALKLEVFSKGCHLCCSGFLRSDTLLGTVNVKLVDLESKCTVHECFDLMDGRKACGGKLEVKVRIRQPLLTKQIEEVREKWLVIGS